MIQSIATLAIYVNDQAQAETFWTQKIGFVVFAKFPMGNGLQWVEVGPPGGQTRLVLYPKSFKPDWNERKPSIVFQCDSVEITYKLFQDRGVNVGSPPQQTPMGTFASFLDDDGNDFLLKS
jgi:lactoylglutathione lyase